MSEYSINVDDWNDYERWEMTGRNIMYSRMMEEGTPQNKEAKKEAEVWGVDSDFEDIVNELADHHIPMMLYAYPLEIDPSEEEIIEVCERTACTVVQDNNTGEYFLALCGGGMDLSQDIALAFNIAQKWLPTSLLSSVCKQYGLTKGGKNFKQIKDIIIEQSEMEGNRLLALAKEWKEIKIPKKDLK